MNRLAILSQKKEELAALRPLPIELEQALEEWYDVELTYSSNAIEGNTLTRIETAEVLEKGTAAVISGKPLKDQLEAINHKKALDLIKKLSEKRKSHQFITEEDIKEIHKRILTDIQDRWAGVYRQIVVFVKGSTTQFPDPHKVPYLMNEFIQWLEGQQAMHPVRIAADAHYKFVSIHPFVDGNGRTARLLMNLVLLLHGYPRAVIRNEERTAYLHALEYAQTKGDINPFYTMIETAVERSLDKYLEAGK